MERSIIVLVVVLIGSFLGCEPGHAHEAVGVIRHTAPQPVCEAHGGTWIPDIGCVTFVYNK